MLSKEECDILNDPSERPFYMSLLTGKYYRYLRDLVREEDPNLEQGEIPLVLTKKEIVHKILKGELKPLVKERAIERKKEQERCLFLR